MALAAGVLLASAARSQSVFGPLLAVARYDHTATLLQSGKVLVVGGANAGGSPVASAELYDPGSNSWSSGGSLATARQDHTATLLADGRVLVVGGLTTSSTGEDFVGTAEIYDPATNGWSSAGSLAIARHYHTATLLPNHKVLVAGGYGPGSLALPEAELYDPSTNSWAAASPPTGRSLATATLLPSGKVLVAGGFDAADNGLASADLYDPQTDSWSPAASMSGTRLEHATVLLPSGKVLVAGGSANTYLSSVLVYDPSLKLWPASADLLVGRSQLTATLLGSGQVLIAGGFQNNPLGASRSVELYTPAVSDADADGILDAKDNCPTVANTDQVDYDADGVGDLCDNCMSVANPRVAPDVATFLSANPWATLTGGQRDDDHDGHGNRCDAKFPGVSGTIVNASDLAQMRASLGKLRSADVCGTSGTLPCAIFDLDEVNDVIGAGDLSLFRSLNGRLPPPKCPSCPLTCQAGTAGSCGTGP